MSKYRLMLVDDEPAWLRSLSLTLESSAGITNLFLCQDSREVLPLLEKGGIGLALLDLTMPGLSGEELFRVFEPYFSRKKGGTGLGLTIVKSIVTDHRGYVRAAPAPDGGTIFSIQLPVA